jgi:ABC-type transport system involved in cytochrome c biogenesis ATPase subunit/GNAT superfamily N-acetyltransferase
MVVTLTSAVRPGAVSVEAARQFDIQFDGKTSLELQEPPDTGPFRIGLLVGPSGSGKTTLLRRRCGRLLAAAAAPPAAAVAALSGPELAEFGLRPAEVRRRALSPGERQRLQLATMLRSGLGVDEFTSGIDRPSAWALALAVRRRVRQQGLSGLVLATVHDDVAPFLQPDWLWYTDQQRLVTQVEPYSIHCVGCRSDGPRWMPEQRLLTSALPPLVGGPAEVRVEGVRPGRPLPAAAAAAALAAGGPGKEAGAEKAKGAGKRKAGAAEREAAVLRHPERRVEFVISPGVPALTPELAPFRRHLGRRGFGLYHRGQLCGVCSEGTLLLPPRLAAFRLAAHVAPVVARLESGPVARPAAAAAEPALPARFGVGLVVGPSGCGKSRAVRRRFPQHRRLAGGGWQRQRAIVDQVGKTVEEATQRLMAVGLDSIPAWLRPHHVLSNGEQRRADLAQGLRSRMVIEDFTAAIDRPSAQSMAAAAGRYIRSAGLQGVVAVASHADIVPFLQPDWVWYMDSGTVERQVPRFRLRTFLHPNIDEQAAQWTQRAPLLLPQQPLRLTGGGPNWQRAGDYATQELAAPLPRTPPPPGDRELTLVVQRCPRSAWELFKRHHYLSEKLVTAARCFVGSIDGKPCAFVAAAPSPGLPWGPTKGWPKRARRHTPGRPRWRESRLVVLPSHQGMGVGSRMSEAVADTFVRQGHQYWSRTSHPKLVAARQRSERWYETLCSGATNRVTEWPGADGGNKCQKDDRRVGYSFEYTGTPLAERYAFRPAAAGEGRCNACNVLVRRQRRCPNCHATPLVIKAFSGSSWALT